MKTTSTILPTENSHHKMTISTDKFVKPILFIFLLSGITLLSSCALWVPAPRHQQSVVIIEQGHSDNSAHKYYKYNNGNKKGNNDNHKKNKGRH